MYFNIFIIKLFYSDNLKFLNNIKINYKNLLCIIEKISANRLKLQIKILVL